jgi:hypothetical protein
MWLAREFSGLSAQFLLDWSCVGRRISADRVVLEVCNKQCESGVSSKYVFVYHTWFGYVTFHCCWTVVECC